MSEGNQESTELPKERVEIVDDGTADWAIDGGTIEPLENIEVKSRRVREATARAIALSLVWILALSAFLHYVGVFVLVLCGKEPAAEELGRFFNSWLPVISGLVGSAVTYYFTKDRS